jgi:hypothetical protein
MPGVGPSVRVTASPASATNMSSYAGANSMSLDFSTATDRSSFNTGKLTGLGLADLEDKLTGLYTPSSLGGTAYSPHANGNGNMDA